MPEERHQRREGHAGVDEGGAERVAKLMRDDSQRLLAGAGEPGDAHGGLEASADAVGARSATAFGEHEVAEPSVARVWQRPLTAPTADPPVKCVEWFGIERHHPFGAELADGDLEPCAAGAEGDEAVELEVEQLADAHPGGAQHDDGGAGEAVVELSDGGHQVTVDGGWERSWERFRKAGQVGEEEQTAWGLARPAPRGDVLEEHA
jgi:hypothetical protein